MVETENPTLDRKATDQDALPLEALAKAVLAREIRPRVASVRRLAEGVLALQQDVKRARKKARKAKAAATKPPRKSKRLAKIPGQKKVK